MTYHVLREFADSWGLLALVTMFVGVVLFTFRPGGNAIHDDSAKLPLRNETAPLGIEQTDGGNK
jgi:cytochrome c oxidase cbb3-type subunit 4